MRISDVDFILVPDWLARPTAGQPDDDHWISRWQRNLATAGWLDSGALSPSEALVAHVKSLVDRPVVIVTHGRGVEVLIDARATLNTSPIAGAFIVAPSTGVRELTAIRAGPLPFPSVLVAPDDHPELGPSDAQDLAHQLGSHFVAAGATQRLDSSSGHGPWPEGLLRLGWFLKQLANS